jgi:hypothetical protein
MKQEIPWNRFAIEAIVIVGSILLAFAIDAWWDERQSEAREQDLLFRLETGFINHISQADSAIVLASRSLQGITTFIAKTPEELEQVPSSDAYPILRGLWAVQGLQQGLLDSRSILSTLDAGRLSLMTDQDLLAALTEWQGELETLEERNFVVLSTSEDTLEAITVYPEVQLLLSMPTEAMRASSNSILAPCMDFAMVTPR